jgi:hypothetical protein
MPEFLYAFAANPDNHDLKNPNSLHDSSLVCWGVREFPVKLKPKSRQVSIECCLLGSRHDRMIHLNYGCVLSHQIREPTDAPLSESRGHGDLLVHEIQVLQDGIFSHELVFSTGFSFLAHFREFEHRVEMTK